MIATDGDASQPGAVDAVPRSASAQAARRSSRRDILQGTLALVGLGLLSGCGVLTSRSPPPPRLPRIGLLAPSPDDNPAFGRGLAGHGYVEGSNIAVEYRYAAETVDQLLAPASELIGLPVDLIVAVGTPAATAAKQVTTTIPIVIVQVGDPVGNGLVASLPRPGGNITGVTNFGSILVGKRLEVLKEVIPGLARVVAIWNSDNPAIRGQVEETGRAARALGIELRSLEVRSRDELPGAFETAALERAQAGIIPRSGFSNMHRELLVELAARSRLPAMFYGRDFAASGGLMALGPQQAEMFDRVAAAVERILNGAKPSDVPVEQPATFDLVINLGTAQALGIAIPQAILAQATELIQ